MSVKSRKYTDNFIDSIIEYRNEVKLFCEEHLVNLTDFANFSMRPSLQKISVRVDFHGFKLWDSIKDDMLTFLEFNEYKM